MRHIATPLILLEEDVLDQIAAEVARAGGRKESGGILLGTRRGDHFHIDQATLPMAQDRAFRFSFQRANAGHQQIASQRWRQSRQLADWLGEWHSHPEPVPLPSTKDLASWRSITQLRQAPMIFLILGYRGRWLGLMQPNSAKPVVYTERERSAAGIGFAPQSARIDPIN